ncbi:MAG: hypothetical protein EOM90_12325 [Alphaproteobacteria bacterium]|nr:hypothetical protein [Alphaproteobacteria bacterium]
MDAEWTQNGRKLNAGLTEDRCRMVTPSKRYRRGINAEWSQNVRKINSESTQDEHRKVAG